MWKYFVLNMIKGSPANFGFRSYYGLHKPILIKTLFTGVWFVSMQFISKTLL
jgi:hypothetical protein